MEDYKASRGTLVKDVGNKLDIVRSGFGEGTVNGLLKGFEPDREGIRVSRKVVRVDVFSSFDRQW